jgi:TPR repeat protein
VQAAKLLEEGDGVPQDSPRAAQLYERSCTAWKIPGYGCDRLGAMLYEGRGVPEDKERGRALLEADCRGTRVAPEARRNVWACKKATELGLATETSR